MGIAGLIKTMGLWIWCLPNNAIGFVAGLGGRYTYDQFHRTVVNVGGWFPNLLYQTTRTPALALGDLILTPKRAFLDGRTYAHELGHVDQYRKLGPLFLPLYGVGAIWGKLRGDAHDANPFEVDADMRAGMVNKYQDPQGRWPSLDRSLPNHPGESELTW